ncbi:MAG: hypothetical protein ACLFQA_06380 [Bacteroidales bacterium]
MKILSSIIALVCLIGAPLLGIHLAGESVADYLYFPPVSIFLTIDHASFSWLIFFLLLALIILALAPFLKKVLSTRHKLPENMSPRKRFPRWGWIGAFILAAGWILAWTRFPWFSQFQTHTFTIPWIGYIILVNALTYMRSGRSMITHQGRYLLLLFLFSAVFWWYFEFLNQFVQNWYYVNVQNMGRIEYFIYATLPFATVLPAVNGTRDLLFTFPGLSAGLDNFFRISTSHPRSVAFIGGLSATAGLAFIGIRPNYLFPLLWLAPLVIIAATVVINRGNEVFKDIGGGDWRNIYLLALSALICGFFWEMWNFYSLTRWEYSVPFVDRFNIFEMPLLGYAGYLPFGLQCGLAAWIVKQISGGRAVTKEPSGN